MNIGTFFLGGDALGTKTNKKVLECCAVLCYMLILPAVCVVRVVCVVCVVCVYRLRHTH